MEKLESLANSKSENVRVREAADARWKALAAEQVVNTDNQVLLSHIAASDTTHELRKSAVQRLSDVAEIEKVVNSLIDELAKINSETSQIGESNADKKSELESKRQFVWEIVREIKQKSAADGVLERLYRSEASLRAAIFDDNKVSKGLFDDMLPEIEKIDDKQVRQYLAENLIDRNIRLNKGKVFLYHVSNQKENFPRFFAFLGQKRLKELFDDFEVEVAASKPWFGNDDSGTLLRYGISLFKSLSEEDKRTVLEAVVDRANSTSTLVFKGFYVGMPFRDFCVMCALRKMDGIDCITAITLLGPECRADGTIYAMEFYRKQRFALFGKEDDEFWDYFMEKYFPDAADRWNTEYDDEMEKWCYVYKSMRNRVKVMYSQEKGILRIRYLGN